MALLLRSGQLWALCLALLPCAIACGGDGAVPGPESIEGAGFEMPVLYSADPLGDGLVYDPPFPDGSASNVHPGFDVLPGDGCSATCEDEDTACADGTRERQLGKVTYPKIADCNGTGCGSIGSTSGTGAANKLCGLACHLCQTGTADQTCVPGRRTMPGVNDVLCCKS